MPPPARGMAPPLAALLCASLLVGCVRAAVDIGYFWHVTDLHFDDLYREGGDPAQNCHEADKRASGRAAGRFGDEACDAPWALVESATRAMKAKHGEVEFVLWTGDAVSEKAVPKGPAGPQREEHLLRNLTQLLSRTFSGQFVFPVLGHRDPAPHPSAAAASRRGDDFPGGGGGGGGMHGHGHGGHGGRGGHGSHGGGGGGGGGERGDGPRPHRPYAELATMWQNWLPPETTDSFMEGGYYYIEQKSSKLRLLMLNTNLLAEGADEAAARRQWNWLKNMLQSSEKDQAAVYLVGHTPPGVDERRPAPPSHFGHSSHAAHGDGAGARQRYSAAANQEYLTLVRRFWRTVAGQFFGHLHSDSFRVIYDKDERPVSWALVAPSVTPRRIHHNSANNPGLRLVKYDKVSGAVMDYAQYYLDLAEANLRGQAEWTHEYNFTQYYQQEAVTPDALHAVAQSFMQNSPLFKRYLDANSAKLPTSCNDGCYLDHYCAMTKVDYDEFTSCVSSAASALASANPSARRRPSPLLSPLLLLLLQLAAALQLLRPLPPPPPPPPPPPRPRRPAGVVAAATASAVAALAALAAARRCPS